MRQMQMKFSQMFMDDSTKQLSLGRVGAAVILLFQLGCFGHMMATGKGLVDLPSNWMLTALALYGINKSSSTVTAITEIKNGVK